MISIIIPVYNAAGFIRKTLEGVKNQKVRRPEAQEVIVVDDGSTDNTLEIIEKYKKDMNLKIIRQKNKGPGAARNKGVKNSQGDIVVFIDSDCIPPKNWLRKLLAPLERGYAGAVGSYKTGNPESPVARFAGWEIEYKQQKMKGESTDWAGSYNCAYRKEVFESVGGFREEMVQAEDADLSFRVTSKGYKIKYVPSAYVYHHHTSTLREHLKERLKRGYWKVFLFFRHKRGTVKNTYDPQSVIWTMNFSVAFFSSIPILLLVALLFQIPLLPFFRWVSPVLLALFLGIFISNWKFFSFLWKKEKRILPLSMLILFTRNLAVFIGMAKGFLTFVWRKIS